jgi:hypothetical protein
VGTFDVIAEFPSFPDNLGTADDGLVWVSFASEPNPALENLHKLPLFLRRLAARLPDAVQPKPSRVAWVAAYDESGAHVLDKWTDGAYAMVTGICRAGRTIWCAGLQERADALRLALMRRVESEAPIEVASMTFKIETWSE